MAKKATNQFLINEYRKSAQQIIDDTVDLFTFKPLYNFRIPSNLLQVL